MSRFLLSNCINCPEISKFRNLASIAKAAVHPIQIEDPAELFGLSAMIWSYLWCIRTLLWTYISRADVDAGEDDKADGGYAAAGKGIFILEHFRGFFCLLRLNSGKM